MASKSTGFQGSNQFNAAQNLITPLQLAISASFGYTEARGAVTQLTMSHVGLAGGAECSLYRC